MELPLLGGEDHRMDVAAWLRGLGLEQYAQLFRDNDIDGEILCGMTAEDLKELGISSFGHRRGLLNAITALGGGPPTRDAAQSARSSLDSPLEGWRERDSNPRSPQKKMPSRSIGRPLWLPIPREDPRVRSLLSPPVRHLR